MIEMALTAAGLAVAIATAVGQEAARRKKKKEEQVEIRRNDLLRLLNLKKEVRRNLDILAWFDGKGADLSSRMAYDPVTRKQLDALRFAELKSARDDIDAFLRIARERLTEKSLSPEDPMRVFWAIKDAAVMLEGLADRLTRLPEKPAPRAPQVILKRRIPALRKKLCQIDKALARVPDANAGKAGDGKKGKA